MDCPVAVKPSRRPRRKPFDNKGLRVNPEVWPARTAVWHPSPKLRSGEGLVEVASKERRLVENLSETSKFLASGRPF